MMWQEFLAQQGAQISEQQDVQGCAAGWDSAALQDGFIAALNDLGLILASGEDAASFLHNQLSNDVERLATDEVRRAAYCSPKGRMLASFLYWKNADGVVLQLSKAIQPAVQKRLQMFVLRAKAKLSDFGAGRVLLGLGGAAAGASLQAWFPQLPAIDGKTDNQYGTLLRLADANQTARYQWIASAEIAQLAWPQLSATLKPVNTSAWRLTEIQAGIAQIIAATQEQFVPQMVNFELIGGVNFRKGCYPGQEIVARSQYLGKLKRRMAIAEIATDEVTAGMEVFAASEPGQPCGMIVNAERNGTVSSLVLVEIKLSDLEDGDIRLGSASGMALRFQPLPYAITDVTQ
ncbi:MAG: folate-binding protein YgfZ [Burkholderiales bacterium]|nr:folate-binding protein YgfZ [Burkholderiales bacterium]